jgi:putative transposase
LVGLSARRGGSRVNHKLTEAIERWRMENLSKGPVKFLYLDGVNFTMRIGEVLWSRFL